MMDSGEMYKYIGGAEFDTALDEEDRLTLLQQQQLWLTQDGQRIPLHEMTDSHIRNCLAMIHRWEMAALDMEDQLSDKGWFVPGSSIRELEPWMKMAAILSAECTRRLNDLHCY